ncbi:hypothetical protein H1215_08410, partial [Anoxybacillus sp. LAT_38]|uniref:hypothetical protein n=1 Tax=Anoxybacillus sp. LAT_26 TaxID=2862719 RepID=UPI001EEC3906
IGILFGSYDASHKELPGEVGVINKQYPIGDVRRYGIFPDGITNWNLNTNYIDVIQQNSANLGIPIYFPSGFYNTELNIYMSNVSIILDKDVEFAGLIHIGSLTETDIKNIVIKGTVVTYDRFGTFKINGLYVERVHVKADGTKALNYPGIRSRGIHIYSGTKNLVCKEMIIEDFDQDGYNNESAFAADGYGNNPQNLKIDRIIVKKSDVHAVYLTGSGHRIGEIIVEEYGAGQYMQDTGLQDSNGLAQSQELKGVWINRCEDTEIGRIIVNQSDEGTRAFAKYDVMVDETGINRYGTVKIGEIICKNVRGASRGVCFGDRFYQSPRCIAQVDKIQLNVATGKGAITDFGVFNIHDNADLKIGSVLFNNVDTADAFYMYRNSKAEIDLIDVGVCKRRAAYIEGELRCKEFRCNRISSLDGVDTVVITLYAHRTVIDKLRIDATVAVTVKALRIYQVNNIQINWLEIGQFRNTEGCVDIDTVTYSSFNQFKLPGQVNKEGIGLRIANLINCCFMNGSIINYNKGITYSGYLTRCTMINVNNAGNTISSDIPVGTLTTIGCQLVET